MSCPEHNNTLLWLYGEGDEAHAAHVAGCASCTALIDEHLDVMGAIAEAGPALRPCEHEADTLLWLYGEGDEAHAAHVANCARCTALAASHESMLGAVAPVATALRTAPEAPPMDESLVEPANARFWPVWPVVGALVAAAAAALVWIGTPVPAPVHPSPAAIVATDLELDLELAALEDELNDLSLGDGPSDFETL